MWFLAMALQTPNTKYQSYPSYQTNRVELERSESDGEMKFVDCEAGQYVMDRFFRPVIDQ